MNYKLLHDFWWDAVSRVDTPTMCPLVFYWKRKKWRWCSAPVKGSIKKGGGIPKRRQRSLLIPSAEYVCLLICVCYPCLCNISRAAPSTRRTASSSDREYFLCEGDIALRWSHRTEGQILDLNNTDGTVEPLSGSRLSQALSAAPDLNRSAASGGWKMRRKGWGFDRQTPLSTAVTFDVWPKCTWQRSPDVDVFLHLCVQSIVTFAEFQWIIFNVWKKAWMMNQANWSTPPPFCTLIIRRKTVKTGRRCFQFSRMGSFWTSVHLPKPFLFYSSFHSLSLGR